MDNPYHIGSRCRLEILVEELFDWIVRQILHTLPKKGEFKKLWVDLDVLVGSAQILIRQRQWVRKLLMCINLSKFLSVSTHNQHEL